MLWAVNRRSTWYFLQSAHQRAYSSTSPYLKWIPFPCTDPGVRLMMACGSITSLPSPRCFCCFIERIPKETMPNKTYVASTMPNVVHGDGNGAFACAFSFSEILFFSIDDSTFKGQLRNLVPFLKWEKRSPKCCARQPTKPHLHHNGVVHTFTERVARASYYTRNFPKTKTLLLISSPPHSQQ